MYSREITSRLGHGLRIRQPRLGAAAATGPVCGATRHSLAEGRAGGDTLYEGEAEDEAKNNDKTARSTDEATRVVKEDHLAKESREIK